MKKGILWMLLSFLLVAALVLTSCGPAVVPGEQEEEEPVGEQEEEEEPVGEQEEEEEEKLQFAYVTAGDLANPFVATLTSGFIDAVEDLGIDSTIGLGEYDIARTISLVDVAIAADVDAILIFSWYEAEGLVPSVQRALAKGIHVAKISPPIPGFTPDEVSSVGIDLVAQGYTIGQYMAEQLRAKGLVTDVKVCVFGENLASPVIFDRKTGFVNALTDEGIGYTYDFIEVSNDFTISLDRIKAYLIANPETDVIMGCGSVPTPTGVMALQELGYEPGEILWTGVDIMPETVEGIRAGYGAVNVDEIWSYGFLGTVALYMRVKYGATVGDLPIWTDMVDADNIEDFVWLLGD